MSKVLSRTLLEMRKLCLPSAQTAPDAPEAQQAIIYEQDTKQNVVRDEEIVTYRR